MIRCMKGSAWTFEANFSNLFNQRATTVYYQFMIPTNLVNPTPRPRGSRAIRGRIGARS